MSSFIKPFIIIILLSNIYNGNCIHSTTVTDKPELEPIPETKNFRIYGKKGKDEKQWFDGRGDMRHIQCVRQGRCEPLIMSTCLGSKIPYSHTSLDLTDYLNQNQSFEILNNYQALHHVPKCWAVIQPFLCAVFAPKCEKIKNQDMVYLPSLEMCKITVEPCRVLYNTTFFPDFLKCNESLFPTKCNNDVREMKFNLTSKCIEPLVLADSSSSYFLGIEGCGVPCTDPLYTSDEHRQIHKLVGWGASICFFCNFFVISTFFIDWQNANKYPALIVFYINLCFAIACLGWLAQFTPGSRDDIVCRKDGTLRHSEPSAGENLSCIVVFVLVYYFLTAAMVWFVFLTYAWHLRAVGNVQDRIDKKGSYFHLVSWSLPLVLTITTMAVSEVDGNSIVGICFVGYINHPIRAGLLLGPLSGIILIGGYFIIRGMLMLFELKNFANDIKSISASNKIHLIIVRMGMCAMFTFMFIFVAIACNVTEFRNSKNWTESFRTYIICKILSKFTDEHKVCKIQNRPSVAILQLHLLCLFCSGIVMSSWCWTRSSIETWKRWIRKKCGQELNEDIKMPKHKVIAQTWAKRKEFEDKGRLSINLYNTHTDPVGLNFDVNDLNSSATNEISSTWANYLPQFVTRRFALTGATANNSSSHGPRKSSLDSEISFSVRHVSVESRRNSVDSQVSVKIAEMKTKVASRSRNGAHQNSKNDKNRNRRREFFSATTGRKFSSRRESSTSVESQVIALKKTTYPNNSHKVGLIAHSKTATRGSNSAKNMKRRSANVGLDPEDFTNFFKQNSHFIIPFLQNQGMTTTSGEETSRASLKIQDSTLDVEFYPRDEDDEQNEPIIEEYMLNNDSDKKISKEKTDFKSVQNSLSFENILSRNSRDRYKESPSRNSKNSTKSRNSRKSNQNHSIRRNRKLLSTAKHISSVTKKKEIEIDLKSDSIINDSTSYSSETDLPILLHSSFSGISLNGKPNSRNSKTSCDVGIQANAYEIGTQFEEKEFKKTIKKLSARNRRKSENRNKGDFESEEYLQLVPLSKNNPTIMSESEKLKMLLLPSK